MQSYLRFGFALIVLVSVAEAEFLAENFAGHGRVLEDFGEEGGEGRGEREVAERAAHRGVGAEAEGEFGLGIE